MIARWFWREWRSPSLLIVWLALSLAVACVLALGNISDRMEKGLSQQSREFMAGDRALRSSREVPQAWLEEAQKRGLKVGKQLTFATMTFAGDTPQLANVKAVDDIYPMYGDLQTNPPGLKPQAGSVLLAPRLMALLNLKTGDTIDVGDATLRIAGEVIQEPDSGFNIFVAEYSPDRKRGFMGSWLDFGSIAGFVLGAGVVVLISTIVGEANFLDWGWRIPFFIALPLGIIGLYLRHALEETPAFQQHVDKLEQGDREGLQDGPKVSFKEIATKHWRSLLTCIGLVIATNVTYYMLLTYMPSYLSHNLHYSEDHGVLIIIAIMIGMLFVQPVMGLLSDRFGRRPFVLLGSVALFVLAIPAFILINSNVIGLIFAGLLMLAVILNCFTGVMASTLPAMFPTHIRYSALAAAFNISVLVAGLTPTLAAWLVESSQNLMMPAYYLMVVAVIGLITGVTMKETANRPLKGATPAASDIQEAKEILVEHYDNIEQKIDNIDHEIADLQAKRTRLVQQHPRIDE